MSSLIKRIFLICLLYSSSSVVGQVNMDSLWSVWNNPTQSDTSRLKAIKDYAWDGYLFSQPDSAFYFAQLQYNFAKSKLLKKHMASALNTQGVSFWVRGNYQSAIDYYTSSLTIKEEIGDKRGIAGSLNNLGLIYQEQGDNSRAITYYTRSLINYEALGDKRGIAITLNNIGLLYQELGNNPKAIDCYTRSLIIREEIGDKRGIAGSLNNLGLISFEQGDNARAIVYYTRSLTIKEEIGDKKGISNTLSNIGDVYEKQGKAAYTLGNKELSADRYVSAITYYTHSLTLCKEIGNKKGIALCLTNLGRIYNNQGNAMDKSVGNAALWKDKYAKAITYSSRALSIAQEVGVAIRAKEAVNTLYEAYRGIENYKMALEMHELYMATRDSIDSENNHNEVIKMEYKYTHEKEKQVLELIQQRKDAVTAEEAKQQKIVQTSLVFGFILMFLLVFVGFFILLQKRKADKILLLQKNKIERKNLKLRDKNEKIKRQTVALKTTNKRFKELDATKNIFFSIIAHDLRNPFNSLLGFSELLLENHTKYDDKKIEHHLKILFQGTRNTYKLLENLLTWSRSQLGHIKFSPEEIDIKILINGIMVSLEETARNKNIKLVNNTENRLIVYADINMISTILRNLIMNAIKFTLKGGEISLNARTVTDENNYRFTEITVKDNGVGISSEIQPNLFKITKKVSTAGTEKEKGIGLGLILCDEFVEKHDGKIWVESEVGKGSEFVFTLPQVKKEK